MGPVEGSVHTQIQWEETDAEYWMENANIANMWGGGAYHREFYLKSDGTLYGRGSNEGGAVGAGISGPAVGARIGGGMTLWQKGFSVGTYGRLAKDTKYGAQYGINDEWFTGTYEDYAIVQQAQPINLTDVTKIVVGAGATFFLKSDNSMWAAGSSGIYELDSNYPWNQTSSSTPVQLLADVTDIAALKYGGVALTTAGKVVKWGINNIGYKTGASWSSNPASTAGVNNTPYEQLEEVMASGGQNIWSDPGPNGAIWIKKNSNELWAVADYPSNWGGNWEIPTYGTPNSGQAWSGISGWAGFETPQQVAFSGVASIIDIATYGSGRAALTQMTSGNYQVWVWGQRSPLFEENPVKLAGEITAPVSSMTPKNIVMNSTYITVRLESGQLLRSSGLETGGIPGQSPFVSAEPSIDVITSGYPSNKSSYGDGWGGNRLLQAGVTRFDSGSNHYAIPESSAWPVVGYSTAKNFWDTDVLAGLCFDKHPSLNIWMWNNTCTIPNSNSGSPGVQRTDPLFYPDGFPE